MSANTQKHTQETGKPDKYNINTTGIPNSNNEAKPTIFDNINSRINY